MRSWEGWASDSASDCSSGFDGVYHHCGHEMTIESEIVLWSADHADLHRGGMGFERDFGVATLDEIWSASNATELGRGVRGWANGPGGIA